MAVDINQIISDVNNAIEGVSKEINNILSDILNAIVSLLGGASTALIQAYTSIGTFLVHAFDTIGNWLHQAFDTVGKWIHDGLNTAYQWIQQGLGDLGNWLQSGLSALGDWIRQGIEMLGNFIKGAWDWFTQNLYNFGQWLWNGLSQLGSYLWAGISWIGSQLYNFGQWLWNGIKWVGGVVWNVITTIAGWIVGLIDTAIETVENWVNGALNTVNSWWTSLISSFREKIVTKVFVDLTILGEWKVAEELKNVKSFKDVGVSVLKMLTIPVLSYLASSILDAVIPKPSQGNTAHLIPPIPVMPKTNTSINFVQPSEPEKPTLGQPYSSDWQTEKPNMGQPYSGGQVTVVANADAKTMIVGTEPVQAGATGTRIRSVTIKAPLTNTSRIWIGFDQNMTENNTFKLYPGEAIDIAIDDLGKLWLRAETDNQKVDLIWIYA